MGLRRTVGFLPGLLLVLAFPAEAVGEYEIGSPDLVEIWVDPVNGLDIRDGASRASALRTLDAAWQRIPQESAQAGSGVRVNLLPGTFVCNADDCRNDYADRRGSAQAPIIVRAADGAGTTTIQGGLNLRNVGYLYLLDLTLAGGGALPTNSSGNNLLHIESGDHVLLRGLTLAGPACASDACNNLQEVLKVNQTSHLYVENSTIGGAWHTSVDYMVVQYGHFINNRVHTAGQWGMYVKGGSAHLRIEGNEFSGTQLGFQAGQSANFAMMRAPWLHYEAMDIKFVNNVLRDIPGVAMSVAGGYNILLAHNTLYRVATSLDPGYPLMSFVHGERNCTATDELPMPQATCQNHASGGGWGPTRQTEGGPAIPNRNVYVYNNLIYNPGGARTAYAHFVFAGPLARPAGFVNSPDPAQADDGLVLRGNVVWNGPADLPLGIDDASGCQPANPYCNETRLRADNAINTVEPQLPGAAAGILRQPAGGNLAALAVAPIPAFPGGDGPSGPVPPTGTLANEVAYDKDGIRRGGAGLPGAYTAVATATLNASADCLYDWAQLNHAGLFPPSGASAGTFEQYYYRHYPATGAYLGVSDLDLHVYYLGPLFGGGLADLGGLGGWLRTAGCPAL
jgi:hypothetical protein